VRQTTWRARLRSGKPYSTPGNYTGACAVGRTMLAWDGCRAFRTATGRAARLKSNRTITAAGIRTHDARRCVAFAGS